MRLERRYAVLAAGLRTEDDAKSYAVDLFRGEHKKAEDVTMAEFYILRAQKLASMSELALLANHGQVFRLLSSCRARPPKTPGEFSTYIVDTGGTSSML